MDKFQFARLISFITTIAGRGLSDSEIQGIDLYIKSQQAKDYNDRAMSDMLIAMRDGKKVEAIKHHREMSGFGLKESKDFVEQHWITHKAS